MPQTFWWISFQRFSQEVVDLSFDSSDDEVMSSTKARDVGPKVPLSSGAVVTPTPMVKVKKERIIDSDECKADDATVSMDRSPGQLVKSEELYYDTSDDYSHFSKGFESEEEDVNKPLCKSEIKEDASAYKVETDDEESRFSDIDTDDDESRFSDITIDKLEKDDTSPPRKKAKTDSVREEMKALVLSKLLITTNSKSEIDTKTHDGWCLVEGLTHCALASNGILRPLIQEHGPPAFCIKYIQKKNTSGFDAYQSFRSLCRIVCGQGVSGNTAKTVWRRLLNVVDASEEETSNLTPQSILDIKKMVISKRILVGLSKDKCDCIIAIATKFQKGSLSDELLLGREVTDDDIHSRLLAILGIGPWSVDMFLLFQCHRADILPLGDVAFRNGTKNLFDVDGSAKDGGLCQKKDAETIYDLHEPFAPFRSISSYYMYKK